MTPRVHILVGEQWEQRLAKTYKSHAQRREAFNLNHFCDIIDVVIGGVNLTEQMDNERVFPFFSSFLEGLRQLATSQAHKVFVECGEMPWEFALCLRGSATLLVSFYSVSMEHEVVCHDKPVACAQFVQAMIEAAQGVMEQLRTLAPEWMHLSQAKRLSAAIEAAQEIEVFQMSGPAQDILAKSREFHVEYGDLRLGFSYKPGYQGLKFMASNHAMDLHALMCPGTLSLEVRGELLAQNSTFAMLALWDWVGMVKRLAYRESVREAETLHLGVRMSVCEQETTWKMTGPWGSDVVKERDLHATELIQGTVALCDLVFQDLESSFAGMADNGRFGQWRGLLDDLKALSLSASEEVKEAKVVALHESLGQSSEASHVESERRLAWSWNQVRAVYPQIGWLRHVPNTDVRDICVTDTLVCMKSEDLRAAFEIKSGQPLWEHPVQEEYGVWVHWRDEVVLMQASAYSWTTFNARSGATLHTMDLPVSVYECRDIIHVETSPMAFVFGSRGEVVALDLEKGEVTWSFAGRSRGAFHYDMNNRFIAHLQGNDITLLDRDTGQVLWETQAGEYARDVRLHQDHVVVIHSGAARAQTHLRNLSKESGSLTQELSIDGRYLGTSRSFGEEFWIVLERQRRPIVEMILGTSLLPKWVHPLASQPRAIAPYVSDVLEVEGMRCVMIQTASQQLLLEMESGRALWSHEYPALERLCATPILLDDGVLSYTEGMELRHLGTGRLIHRFDEFLEEPHGMWTHGETLEVVVAEGHNPAQIDTLMNVSYAYYLALV